MGKCPCCTLKQSSGLYRTPLTDQAHDTAPAENLNTTPFKFLERLFKEDVDVEASTPKLNFSTSSTFMAFFSLVVEAPHHQTWLYASTVTFTNRPGSDCPALRSTNPLFCTNNVCTECLSFSSFCLAPSPYIHEHLFLYIWKWSCRTLLV